MNNLDLFEKAMGELCVSREMDGYLDVCTLFFFDGDSQSFRLEEVAPKTLKLYTAPNVLEWFCQVMIDVTAYEEEINAVCKRFGAEWDGFRLSLTFRRNDMTLAEAYFKLIKIMGIVGTFNRYVYFKDKP